MAKISVCINSLNSEKTIEIISNILQKIDSRLVFRVKLNEDNTSQIIANNVAKLKEVFGKYVKFKK